ncbi:MAG: OmpA family protein [Pseudomonadota bacterium]
MVEESQKNAFSEFFEEDEKPIWMTTYADMMTLLLVFFVLLYSIYFIETEDFKESVSAIEISVDEDGPTVSLIDFMATSKANQPITFEDATGLRQREELVRKELQDIVDSANLANSIFTYVDADKVVLQVPGELLFASGRAQLNPEAIPLFDEIKKTFDNYADYTINIRGHTDDQPIQTAQFPSNWELSAVRATTVLRYFLQQGIAPDRISATGYADLLPVAPNDLPEGRAANRRVEFVLEKDAR